MKKRALQAVMATAWAMTPEYCELIADIAARESEFSGNLEALEAKLGRPLGNTERTTTRDGIAIMPVQGPLFAKANLKPPATCEAFLDAVRPRLAVVQAGYRNRYGHPAPPVMARYAQRGITVAGTPACGAATWSSAQPGQIRCERNEALRYWHHRPQDLQDAAP